MKILIFLAILISLSNAQNFIVELVHTRGSDSTTKCAATLFNSSSFAVAPASCFQVPAQFQLQLRASSNRSAVTSTGISTEAHPNFNEENPDINNVGIVTVSLKIIFPLKISKNSKI
jgi:hypothetical protein